MIGRLFLVLFLGVLLVAAVAGCAPAHLSGSGKPAPTEPGYEKLCSDTPSHPLCGGRK